MEGKSFSEGFFYGSQLQAEVSRLVKEERVDLVYIFSSVMAQFLPIVMEVPVIVDFVDVDSDKWGQLAQFRVFPLSYLFRLEQRRLLKFELKTSRSAHTSVFVSQAEADLFRDLGGEGSIVVIPNGVDSDIRRLPLKITRMGAKGSGDFGLGQPRLIFVGTMNYYPNEDAVIYFAREILPIIQKQFPKTTFEIVGRAPSSAVRRLDRMDGVRVLGEVGDVRAHLVQADVSVAPMRIARGVQNKVLEAMAIGVPVVATSEAIKGLSLVKGDELVIGDTPEEFAAQVLRVLSDRTLYDRVATNGHSCVLENYSWRMIGAQLSHLIEGVFKPRASANVNFIQAKHGLV